MLSPAGLGSQFCGVTLDQWINAWFIPLSSPGSFEMHFITLSQVLGGWNSQCNHVSCVGFPPFSVSLPVSCISAPWDDISKHSTYAQVCSLTLRAARLRQVGAVLDWICKVSCYRFMLQNYHTHYWSLGVPTPPNLRTPQLHWFVSSPQGETEMAIFEHVCAQLYFSFLSTSFIQCGNRFAEAR